MVRQGAKDARVHARGGGWFSDRMAWFNWRLSCGDWASEHAFI